MTNHPPRCDGFVTHEGVRIHYEVHGDGPTTVLLLPTWTIVHKRFWKMQVPYLASHARVITYDAPGNGRSDRVLDPAAYGLEAQTAHALRVLDATNTARAATVSLSLGANMGLKLAADHGERVLGTVLIAPSVPIPVPPGHHCNDPGARATGEPLPPSVVASGGRDPTAHWVKYEPGYRHDHFEDFAWFFFGQCFTEPHSSKPIEDCVAWAMDTRPEVLAATDRAPWQDEATLRAWCERIASPLLLIHGDDDRVSPIERSERLAAWSGGALLRLEGSGHVPLARDPVRVNLEVRRFVEQLAPAAGRTRRWTRGLRREPRVLYVSSPIGLGHARRDVAIARALRSHHPDVEIDWLAQHPVTRVLEDCGERIHPASRRLRNESTHIEAEAREHTLDCFHALRTMDEILLANFMVFVDLVREEHYDLVVGDEAWELDHYLHENPELKRFAFAWLTDFVGYLPMRDGDAREAYLTADYNAETIRHVERFPRVRDRALFVGDPDDIVAERFGTGLPDIRDWTAAHFEFPGYVTGFDATDTSDRAALRDELGYRSDERVCIVTVGGSGVGGALVRRAIAAYPEAKRRVPDLRMVVVAGPRLHLDGLTTHPGLDVRSYVPELHRHLACCDLAVVQGGLTTCMELTAHGTPFVYVPLRLHFEQNRHVAHRLDRYAAGRRLTFEEATPDRLAHAITEELGRDTRYRPVSNAGAARAAASIASLL